MCCTESDPAWLLVSLGSLRPVATVQAMFHDDLSFTIALANASTGPFVTVVTQICAACTMNQQAQRKSYRTYAVPGAAPVVASFVRMRITYSSSGGIGGCSDLCDWATNVYTFAVFGPGALPPFGPHVLASPPPPALAISPPQLACATVFDLVSPLVGSAGSDVVLTGGAELQPPGSGPRGSRAVRLTTAESLQRGAVEYTRIVRPAEECDACSEAHLVHVSMYVWLGASRSLPGEGLIVSMVDAARQTPGATRYMDTGCGISAALPQHALSIVLDTADNNAGCEQPGTTGMHVISTLNPEAPPVVLQTTMDASTAAFRKSGWVPLEFHINRQLNAANDTTAVWAPRSITVNGDEQLSGFGFADGLDAFYIVVSGRTSDRFDDEHVVSSLKVSCNLDDPIHLQPENWAGFRQPLTPPPKSPPPRSSLPPAPPVTASPAQLAQSSAVGFIAAFSVTTTLAAAALAVQQRRRRSDDDAAPLIPSLEKDDTTAKPSHTVTVDVAREAHDREFDVFLPYRRVDCRLADAVQDKLRLCGLRVFRDVDGRLAGTPFGTELIRAVHATPVFAPLVTLPCLQRMAVAGEPDAEVDFTLAEWLAAVHFRATGSVRLIYPLLAGPPPAVEAGRAAAPWESLAENPAYALALAALPDAVPVATIRSVSAALLAAFGAPLPDETAAMTVRDIVCGRRGVLSGQVFPVDCLPDDLGLYIRDRYAPPMLRVVEACAQAERTEAR